MPAPSISGLFDLIGQACKELASQVFSSLLSLLESI